MSKWENLKKNIGRTGGKMFKGDDLRNAAPDLYEQAERFEILKKKADRLQLEARNFLDSVKKMSFAQKELAKNLSVTSGGTNDHTSSQHKLAQASTFINDNIFAQFEQLYSTTVLEPIETYCSYLPDFEEAISKTKKRLQDLEKARSQYSKAVSKSPEDPVIAAAVSYPFHLLLSLDIYYHLLISTIIS
ncbi:hypothetical protein BB561_001680 [Smittium simulii]|uniref:BAR domain-containing protein n=1 Tax=Smittium simulii TaxID=133385 RepID=A0A2T9YTH4_9FUNG|nr:hypothetical protein BB561_001680 [Smittium simulii]